MDIICVNASFDAGQLEFWKKHNVVHPELDKMYTVRGVNKFLSGDTGIWLEEIVNPKVPIKHNVLGTALVEPSWNMNRFRTLAGDIVKKEELILENV